MMSSKNQCWCTPKELYDELDSEFHFDLDPACTDKSAKCEYHFTPKENGLIRDWRGRTVFCNPPYGKAIKDWVKKCYEEGIQQGFTDIYSCLYH